MVYSLKTTHTIYHYGDTMLKKLIPLFLLLAGFQANAAIISGTHSTTDGKSVALQGLEWLSWDETYNLTRTAVEAGGYFNDGWRYAIGAEFGGLISSIWGGASGENTGNYDGSQWLWENFDNYDFIAAPDDNRIKVMFIGDTSACSPDQRSCAGIYEAFNDQTYGMFNTSWGATGTDFALIDYNRAETASVLVRVTPIPEPSIISLLALGLFGFKFVGRHKVQS
jgi:hypothetical protein